MKFQAMRISKQMFAVLVAVAVLIGAVAAARATECGDGDGCAEPALIRRAWLPVVASDQSSAPVRPVPPTPEGNGP